MYAFKLNLVALVSAKLVKEFSSVYLSLALQYCFCDCKLYDNKTLAFIPIKQFHLTCSSVISD